MLFTPSCLHCPCHCFATFTVIVESDIANCHKRLEWKSNFVIISLLFTNWSMRDKLKLSLWPRVRHGYKVHGYPPKRKVAAFGKPRHTLISGPHSQIPFRFPHQRTFIKFSTYLCFHEFSSFSQFQLFWDKTSLLVILQPIVTVRHFRDSRLQRLHSILVQIIPSKTLLCSTLQQIQLLKMPEVYISQSML